nr:MAG TPA: hypothetical protein [Caudoviricetes sp.]
MGYMVYFCANLILLHNIHVMCNDLHKTWIQ